MLIVAKKMRSGGWSQGLLGDSISRTSAAPRMTKKDLYAITKQNFWIRPAWMDMELRRAVRCLI